MAVLNTVGSFYLPHFNRDADKTPVKVEYLQTAGSGATSGAVKIFASATASNDFFLTNINLTITDATAASVANIYIGTNALATYPTGTANVFSYSFGPIGLNCGTTTTATVSLLTSGGTATLSWIATGFRKL